MDKNTLNFLLIYGLPFFLIFFMLFFVSRSNKARQQEAAIAYKKDISLREENNRLLKEILKTLKRLEKNSRLRKTEARE